ncbi:MAG: phytanoyl-CoA dioxygenase family protein [Actinomycetota bacterium]
MPLTTDPHDVGPGWRDVRPDDPAIESQRQHLANHNGLRGLEIFEPGQIDDIVRVFRRDGFVVVADVLTPSQLERLRDGVGQLVEDILALDPDRAGNRGSHRYSFGAASTSKSQLHRPEWQMLLDLPTLAPIVAAVFGSDDYLLRSCSGDFCLPGAYRYQPLHSDMRDWTGPDSPHSSFHDPRRLLTTRELPCPYVCANFLTVDATPLNGSTRQIPGTQHSREPFPTLDEEPEWMKLSTVCPAPAGAVQLRDVRAWHGGTPNLSDEVRAIPNVEYYAPWFREPISPSIAYADHQRLSQRARHLTRFHVLDSSASFEPGLHLNVTPPRLRTDGGLTQPRP